MDKTLVTEYTNISNTIKTTNAKLKVLRDRLKELDLKINNEMLRSNIQVINLSQGGQIEKKKLLRKKPLNKQAIVDKIRQRLENSQAERLIEELYANRSTEEVEKIYYKR